MTSTLTLFRNMTFLDVTLSFCLKIVIVVILKLRNLILIIRSGEVLALY